ncbi:MAG: AAA family ATPase [Acidimicrobiales bacterium]
MATVERPGSTGQLVGRRAERESIARALDEVGSGNPRVVWVEGDAGMGKTALVRHAVAQLPAGLQLAHTDADELAAGRPFELARQLGSTSAESFAAGMEILEVWSQLQDDGPVVVVVEDLHWADSASSKALLSAVQRLDKDRVIVLVTTRPEPHDGWERLRSDPERCLTITLAPFDVGEVELFASTEGIDLTPYQAERLRSHTAGHPLYLRTLLAELNPADLQRPDGDLPAPRSLTSSVTARLSESPESARALVAAMAVMNQRAPLTVVARLAGVGSPVEPFEELLGTGFVRWDPREPGAPVEFVHPLYRQAVYDDLSPSRRRDLHHAAAQGTSPAQALAHRVAAADGADETLAGELDAKARHELEMGNKLEAGRTFQWASSLSVDSAEAQRRQVQAALAYVDAGQLGRAEALRYNIESFGDGPGRSLVLGLLEWDQGHAEDARQWLERVVDEEDADGLDAQTMTARAWAELAEIHITLGQGPEAARAAAQALALSSPHTSAERLASIHAALAEGHMHGAASGLARLRRRLPQPAADVPGVAVDVLVVRATLALLAGQIQAALVDLRAVVALTQRGFIPVELARTHRQLGSALLTTGEWDEALVQARTGLGIAADDHRGVEEAACHGLIATILAYRGNAERAEAHVAAAAESAARIGAVEGVGLARVATAALGLASGQPEHVIEALDPLVVAAPMLAALTFWPSHASALIETGNLERARTSIEGLESAAAARGLDMTARLLGLRARLAKARGELDQADELFTLALDRFSPNDPFLERTLLLHMHGQLQLDRGERNQAVAILHTAQELLLSVGAEPFASRVESDLKRAGARSTRRSARSSLELTDREHDVAVLVAKGYSNPEAAAELYVSRKAIEYHLRNIYGKLGIASRRELRGLDL